MRSVGILAAAGAAALSFTQVASATPTSVHPETAVSGSYYGVEAQWDNSPGDGAASWVWLYGGDGGGHVNYQGYDSGQSGTLTANAGQAVTTEPSWDIWRQPWPPGCPGRRSGRRSAWR